MSEETLQLIEQFKTARGERWAELFKEIYFRVGGQIVRDAVDFRVQDGKITILHIGRLCVRYNINFKTMCEQFLEGSVLPTGTFDLIMQGGWNGRIKEILREAKEAEAHNGRI
jgi:hypothetical protein